MKCKRLRSLSRLMVAASLTHVAPGLSQQAAPSLEDLEGVVAARDVDYIAGTDYAEDRDKLDVFMPEGAAGAPVVVFFHGGALQQGDKSYGEVLVRRFVPEGVGVVSANYRLSPGVMHPAHIQDAAAAFAWVVKNIAGYGGDPERVYVSGHSAGAYLATLMALDPAHLASHGLGLDAIRGGPGKPRQHRGDTNSQLGIFEPRDRLIGHHAEDHQQDDQDPRGTIVVER